MCVCVCVLACACECLAHSCVYTIPDSRDVLSLSDALHSVNIKIPNFIIKIARTDDDEGDDATVAADGFTIEHPAREYFSAGDNKRHANLYAHLFDVCLLLCTTICIFVVVLVRYFFRILLLFFLYFFFVVPFPAPLSAAARFSTFISVPFALAHILYLMK